jgi:hypothetical protein
MERRSKFKELGLMKLWLEQENSPVDVFWSRVEDRGSIPLVERKK